MMPVGSSGSSGNGASGGDEVSVVPSDWPGEGPIDLAVHDRPHASSTTEWWYVNGHVDVGGQPLSFFAAFFRQVKGYDPKTKAPLHAHSLTWGIFDPGQRFAHTVSRVDPSGPEEGRKRIKRGLGGKDHKLNRALSEILDRGNVPLPDRIFESRVFVHQDRLELQYGNALFRKLDDGCYQLTLSDAAKAVGIDLVIAPKKPPVRQGDDGVVRGSGDESMFYYFIPRCSLSGTVTVRGLAQEISSGQGWYDHEFGVGEREDVDDEAEAKLADEARSRIHADRRARYERRQVAWNWLSMQLDDGSELSLYDELYVNLPKVAGHWAIAIDPRGERTLHKDWTLEATRVWRSTQTFFEYPVDWRVKIPAAQIDLEITAAFDDQEFITLISKPSFWEGRVTVKGTVKGKPVSGLGVLERSGYASYEDLEGFFEEVGKVVRDSVERTLPRKPTYAQAKQLIASDTREQYMRGVDIDQYARTHLHPIREIVDRGGKGWRSYAAITCADIVGGNSRNFVKWIALPELMHVGSLIVDDVEDKSVTRRGGPTAHLMFGDGQAINSGTAAYFIGIHLLDSELVSDADQIRIYELYFEALRAGHAGQALDIDGFEGMMPEVVESGDSALLEQRVLAVHRLKTAAPAGCLARMGAIAGGGTDTQMEGLGLFFEDLGLAFQIVDDVLNLRGFKGELKAKAEDIMQGKITLPVAKAMGRLPIEERRWLWETLRTKPQEQPVVAAVVQKLEDCGAIESCAVQARALVEEGWLKLEPLVDDSLPKLVLRAFGWYVLERHY
jgi:geranylgeranyl pyrophosphate synthase/predicted secreted hydrolase